MAPPEPAAAAAAAAAGPDPAADPGPGVMGRLRAWGTSSLPPALLATLITALHARPAQPLALALFPGPLLFASYLNVAGWPTGSAGLAAAWSGLYAVLALRRRQPLLGRGGRLSARGAVRGAAVVLGLVNCGAGAWAYARGDVERDAAERARRRRWGAVG